MQDSVRCPLHLFVAPNTVHFEPVGPAGPADPDVHIDLADPAENVLEAVHAACVPVDPIPCFQPSSMSLYCSSGPPAVRLARVAQESNCSARSDQSSESRSLTAETATAEHCMRPALVVVGVAAAVEDAPIAVVAAGGYTPDHVVAAGSPEAESAALDPVHDAVGNSGSSVGVAEDQLRACLLTWS
jgi:hypothetical protein